jgi:integration host factor subunit alpha
VGLPRHEAAELVGQVIDEICSTRAAEEAVKLSSFGIFMVRKKGKRVGRAQDSRERQQVEPRSE